MAIKLVTEPGMYNGKFRKAGQSYDTEQMSPPDKPDVLNAEGVNTNSDDATGRTSFANPDELSTGGSSDKKPAAKKDAGK